MEDQKVYDAGRIAKRLGLAAGVNPYVKYAGMIRLAYLWLAGWANAKV